MPVEHGKKIERRKFALGCRPCLCWQKIIIPMKEGRKRRRESVDNLPVRQEKKVTSHDLPVVQRVKSKSTWLARGARRESESRLFACAAKQ